jgi:hypothetical protein
MAMKVASRTRTPPGRTPARSVSQRGPRVLHLARRCHADRGVPASRGESHRRTVDRPALPLPQRKEPHHDRVDRGARSRRRQRVRARVRHPVRGSRLRAVRPTGGGVRACSLAGATQHLSRPMGRGRALEVMLSAEDDVAELAERYGWVNRALPATSWATSSVPPRSGSPASRQPRWRRSRTGWARSPSHRPTTSGATPTSSPSARANRPHGPGPKP